VVLLLYLLYRGEVGVAGVTPRGKQRGLQRRNAVQPYQVSRLPSGNLASEMQADRTAGVVIDMDQYILESHAGSSCR
jgi:hypothetical protein